MVIAYNWLLDYLPTPLPIQELSNILTSIGLEVEHIETVEAVKGSLEGFLIGKVLTCEKHPNADKLSVTTVSIGSEAPLHIVCGAPNVAVGQHVVVAPVGTRVHPLHGEAFAIKKAKIRGELSEGMICAEDEIGLGASHNGILVLPETATIGMLAKEYFNIPAPDYAIHIGLTPNRSDAMSHIGVAKDVCAYLSHHRKETYTVKKPDITINNQQDATPITVSIQNKEACPRYCGLTITGIKVGESPDWLKRKLNTIGIRSINNIVDITNFVLHEYGQPLHAFDAKAIVGNEVNVATAVDGSKFRTLDDKEITLAGNDLMICNASEPMCLAGIYGGLASGVTNATTEVFLESAYFNPSYIRKSSLHHGLRTDAATHFEKGVDMNHVIPALIRAAQLIQTIAGGTISSKLIDNYPTPFTPTIITTTYDYIHKLSGKQYPKEAILTILKALDFEVTENEQTLTIQVPSNKVDVTQPADIVEEIVRIDGLDNILIPEKLNISLIPTFPNDRKLRDKNAEMLCAIGFQEVVTNSVTNSNYYQEQDPLVKMLNSLSSELDCLRPSMMESGLEVINYNLNRKNTNLALFEFGKTYKTKDGNYVEEEQLAFWCTGNVKNTTWNEKQKPFDFYYLKGVLQQLFTRNGIQKLSLNHDQQSIEWLYKNELLATLAQVAPPTLKKFDIKQTVYFAKVHWKTFLKATGIVKIKYTEVPKYPSVQRDLALVLDKSVTYKQVQQATEQLNIQALTDYQLFDVFENEALGANKKSYALSYTFQLLEKTLTDVEIEQHMKALIQNYESKLNALIRK